MADFEPLVSADELKTDWLMDNTLRSGQINVRFDADVDMFMLLFAPTETETFVHYVDDAIGLLCRIDDLQVVGFQIEAFTSDFLPQHADVKRIWSFKDTGLKVDDLGDLFILAEQNKLTIARAIVRITRATLDQNKISLALPRESELVYA